VLWKNSYYPLGGSHFWPEDKGVILLQNVGNFNYKAIPIQAY